MKEAEWLKSILVCPACKTPGIASNVQETSDLRYHQCVTCNRIYPVDQYGVIDFQVVDEILSLPDPFLGMWALAQNNSLQEYEMRSPGSIASPEREEVKPFSNFMDLNGLTVLDIGSGTDYIPAYINNHSIKHYVALDPLPVNQDVPYIKVQAWAELMPFADNIFDAVILGTSIDHILCLESFWNELFRILKDNGVVYIWGDIFMDPTFYKNIPPHPLFKRDRENILEKDEALNKFKSDSFLLKDRFSDVKSLQQNYGNYLVDKYHFRHIHAGYFKNIKAYGFDMEKAEVIGIVGHGVGVPDTSGYIYNHYFMKTFLKLRKGGTGSFEGELAKRHLDVTALLAKLTERLYFFDQKLSQQNYRLEQKFNQLELKLNQQNHQLDQIIGQSKEEIKQYINWLAAVQYNEKKLVLERPFIHHGENSWLFGIPQYIEFSDNEFVKASPLILFEDDKELGPAHALHEDIREHGGGLYSHWKESLYFSTSDNSDPNTNGRNYWVTVKI